MAETLVTVAFLSSVAMILSILVSKGKWLSLITSLLCSTSFIAGDFDSIQQYGGQGLIVVSSMCITIQYFITKGKTKIISSTHFSEEPSSASEILDDIEDMADSGDIIKVCYNTTGRNSALKLFEAAWMLKESDKKTAIMGLGVGGDWTRIHAPLLNQYLVYSTMETGSHLSSEGRINASDLLIAWEMLNYE